MTLEWYAEPFAASGRYRNFGELPAAGSQDLRIYGTDGTTIATVDPGKEYQVTDGSDTFTIEQADFNVFSYRTNLVLRWEWRPGSTLFLVWQQNRSQAVPTGDLVGPRDLGHAMSAPGDNFFGAKITYWIPFL